MTTTRSRTAAALTLTATLALGACGSGDDAKSKTSAAVASGKSAATSAGVSGSSAAASGGSSASAGPSSSSTSAADDKAPTAAEAWKKARTRLASYKTITMKGVGEQDGTHIETSLHGAVDGSKTENTSTMSQIGTVRSITIDNTQYLQAPAAYWKKIIAGQGGSSADIAKITSKVEGKWVKAPATSAVTGAVKAYFTQLTKDDDVDGKQFLAPSAKITKDKVGSKDAWKITSGTSKATVWVSADGNYDVLRYAHMASRSPQIKSLDVDTTIVDHDKPDDGIKAPAGALDAKTIG